MLWRTGSAVKAARAIGQLQQRTGRTAPCMQHTKSEATQKVVLQGRIDNCKEAGTSTSAELVRQRALMW